MILYLLLRLVRKLLPRGLYDWLIRRGIFLRPGEGIGDAAACVEAYAEWLRSQGMSFAGKAVLEVGYGGSFGTAEGFLLRGARVVYLYDPFVFHQHPKTDRITILEDLSRASAAMAGAIDIILSNAVLEHVRDVEQLAHALARLLSPAGISIHIIDLRDHAFHYPFHMLFFSERAWRVLDPPTHLNRLRVWQYEEIFRRYFDEVSIFVLERKLPLFLRFEDRIQPEFLSGDPEVDAMTSIVLVTKKPR